MSAVKVHWIKTDKHVYSTIVREHMDQLCVHSSYSNPSGDCPLGHGYPEMLTEWGFKDADAPLIKHHKVRDEHFYYIAIHTAGTD